MTSQVQQIPLIEQTGRSTYEKANDTIGQFTVFVWLVWLLALVLAFTYKFGK